MKNPWEEIKLSDYENHMKWASVMQLQALNTMMKKQLDAQVQTVMILGIAGGNGLEHINPQTVQKVYGVDINASYLKECAARHQNLKDILECVCLDLTAKNIVLPHADLVLANLLIEYIGYSCFQNAVAQINSGEVSCIIQIDPRDRFVSDSPYLPAFDGLDRVHTPIREEPLSAAMKQIGYCLTEKSERRLPNGKKLVQLDFRSAIKRSNHPLR